MLREEEIAIRSGTASKSRRIMRPAALPDALGHLRAFDIKGSSHTGDANGSILVLPVTFEDPPGLDNSSSVSGT